MAATKRSDQAPFDVQLTRQAEKDLKNLRAFLPRVMRALAALETDPFKGHTLTGSLRGVRSLEFSLPGGAHRAAYYVETAEHLCLVFAVGAHEGFYEVATRRHQALIKSGELKPFPQSPLVPGPRRATVQRVLAAVFDDVEQLLDLRLEGEVAVVQRGAAARCRPRRCRAVRAPASPPPLRTSAVRPTRPSIRI